MNTKQNTVKPRNNKLTNITNQRIVMKLFLNSRLFGYFMYIYIYILFCTNPYLNVLSHDNIFVIRENSNLNYDFESYKILFWNVLYDICVLLFNRINFFYSSSIKLTLLIQIKFVNKEICNISTSAVMLPSKKTITVVNVVSSSF